MSAQDRNDYERDLREAITAERETIAQIEARIRARERQTIRWLVEKPWLAGADLADTVASCRRAHTESIAREIADRRAAR
jgi:hypothetical protein